MSTLVLFLVVLVAIAVAMTGMAVGVLSRRPCLRGSCGGPGVVGRDGARLSCDGCPRNKSQAPMGRRPIGGATKTR